MQFQLVLTETPKILCKTQQGGTHLNNKMKEKNFELTPAYIINIQWYRTFHPQSSEYFTKVGIVIFQSGAGTDFLGICLYSE